MIKKLCLSELQRVLYVEIAALGYNIYDDAPKDADYPYMMFGHSTSGDNRCKDRHGEEVTQIIDVFSVYEGYKETQEMMSAIVEIMSDHALTMTGFKIITRTFDFAEVLYESLPDNRVLRHGVVKYRFKIEQL